jgi:PAS domain S-box-containing protein
MAGASQGTSAADASEVSPEYSAGELDRLFHVSLSMLCIAGADGYFKRVNPAFERTLGYNSRELLSRPILEFVHPDDWERTQSELRNLVAGSPTVHFENRYRCKDGSYRWLAWTAMPQEQGTRIYATASDVTLQKQTEEALRASERRYRKLLDAVTTYRYTVELENHIPVFTFHGHGCLAATGYAPEDFASDPHLWFRMVHSSDRETVQRHVAAVHAGSEVPPLEHRIFHRDGRTRWVRNTIILHRDDRGQLASYDGLVEDVTDRRHLEEQFRRLLESAPDAMAIVDRGGKIVLVNAQTEHCFGYRREELLGQPVEILVPERFRAQHVEDRAAYSASPRPRLMGARPDLYARRKDGSEFLAEISLSPIETDEGVLIACAVRDITERRRTEREVRENEVQLLAARKIQEHFLPDALPALAGFDVAGACYPAASASGDYFDYLPLPGDAIGFVTGDASGHGFGPALVMTSTQAFLRAVAPMCATIGEVLSRANRFLVQETDEGCFVTLLLARLDPPARRLTYASAGHPTGYVIDAAGGVKARLPSTGFPLGVFGDAEFPTGDPIVLEPGDMVLLLTDGILEVRSPAGTPFGDERALEIARASRSRSSREIIEALYRAVLDFSQSEQPDDDVTAIVIKTKAPIPDNSSVPGSGTGVRPRG